MNANIFKYAIAALALLVGITIASCNSKPQANTTNTVTESCDSNLQISANDKLEIEKLFRDMIEWEIKDTIHIDLVPVIANENESKYIGLDLQKLEITTQELKKSGFFSQTFIDNYKRLITELDRKMRNNEFEEWLVGDLPPFKFANDVSPFFNCQETAPVDSISFLSENPKNVKAKWFANFPDTNGNMQMTVMGNCNFEKEQDHWKISYLPGFDYEDGIKRDGEFD